MNTMSKEELRIEIAKLQGWTGVRYLPMSETVMGYSPFDKTIPIKVPDYPNDIKAAYELEGSVPEEKWNDYIHRLELEVAQDLKTIWTSDFDDEGRYEVHPFHIAHATPEQRCRAYVMTMKQSNNDRALPIP